MVHTCVLLLHLFNFAIPRLRAPEKVHQLIHQHYDAYSHASSGLGFCQAYVLSGGLEKPWEDCQAMFSLWIFGFQGVQCVWTRRSTPANLSSARFSR